MFAEWIIAPQDAQAVELNWNKVDTEYNFDVVFIGECLTMSCQDFSNFWYWSGDTIGEAIVSETGILLVSFTSDSENNYRGFEIEYEALGGRAQNCPDPSRPEIVTVIGTEEGVVDFIADNRGYSNNAYCSWILQLQDASELDGSQAVEVSFTEFATERDFDFVRIFECLEVLNGVCRVRGETYFERSGKQDSEGFPTSIFGRGVATVRIPGAIPRPSASKL